MQLSCEETLLLLVVPLLLSLFHLNLTTGVFPSSSTWFTKCCDPFVDRQLLCCQVVVAYINQLGTWFDSDSSQESKKLTKGGRSAKPCSTWPSHIELFTAFLAAIFQLFKKKKCLYTKCRLFVDWRGMPCNYGSISQVSIVHLGIA